jgi:hypothetical protein
LEQEPADVALLADHAHPIRMLLDTLFGRHDLHPFRQKPPDRSGGRDVNAVPGPRVCGRPLRVAVKEGGHLVGAAKKLLLGRDHDDVGIRREQFDDTIRVERRESRAEALEEFEQRDSHLLIRPHDRPFSPSGMDSRALVEQPVSHSPDVHDYGLNMRV